MKKVILFCAVKAAMISCSPQQSSSVASVGNSNSVVKSGVKEDLQAQKTAQTVVVVASNASFTYYTKSNGFSYYYGADVVKLSAAAKELSLPVCNSEDAVSLPSQNGNTPGTSANDLLDECRPFVTNFTNLRQLKTAKTVLIVADNGATIANSSNGGVNYYFDDDVELMQNASQQLGVKICDQSGKTMSTPSQTGNSEGASIQELLQACSAN